MARLLYSRWLLLLVSSIEFTAELRCLSVWILRRAKGTGDWQAGIDPPPVPASASPVASPVPAPSFRQLLLSQPPLSSLVSPRPLSLSETAVVAECLSVFRRNKPAQTFRCSDVASSNSAPDASIWSKCCCALACVPDVVRGLTTPPETRDEEQRSKVATPCQV
jgi:hypothetical protein